MAVLARDGGPGRGDVPRGGRPPGRPVPDAEGGPVPRPDPLALAAVPPARVVETAGAGAGPVPVARPGARPGGQRGGVLAGTAGRRATGLPPAARVPRRGRPRTRRPQAAAPGAAARPVVPVPATPTARLAGGRRRGRDPGAEGRLGR